MTGFLPLRETISIFVLGLREFRCDVEALLDLSSDLLLISYTRCR